MTMIQAIGFANKFYTLWNIYEDVRPLGNGHNMVTTRYVYVQNISFDKETAMAKYPDAIFDSNLHGMTKSWQTEKEVWNNVDVFRFGKYKYEKIDNTDLNYLSWYWDQIDGDHKEYVGKILEANGYEIRTNTYTDYYGEIHTSTYLMDPEALAIEKRNGELISSIEEKALKGEILEFTPTHNLDESGEVREGDVIYHFNDIKESYYNGYIYALPLDKNGKAKRIKNKTIKVTKYVHTRNNSILIITVLDFEIVK